MDDLISKQAAIAALGERPLTWVGGDYELGRQNQFDSDLLAIENVPSSPPEIVRCRDCKHFNSYFVECDHESGLKRIKDDHDYCCHADRRQDE